MRLNKYLAQYTGLSRRVADQAIETGRVTVNGQMPPLGYNVLPDDIIKFDGQTIAATPVKSVTIMLNKPAGYVCSRNGQGSRTIYDLLPPDLRNLKPVGRLDKDSTGLLLLTNDGQLAHRLTHPSFQKTKIYRVQLDQPLRSTDEQRINKGIELDDGLSHMQLRPLNPERQSWQVTMQEGRNRQIRRTFAAAGYEVIKLHRTNFGDYQLGNLPVGKFNAVEA